MKSNRVSFPIALLFLLCASEVIAGERAHGPAHPGVGNELYNGTLDDAHPEVVLIESDNGLECSGTLIAPRLVLTASHCIPADKSLQTRVWFGSHYGESAVIATMARAHPVYDVGLLWLEADAPNGLRGLPLLSQASALLVPDAPARVVGFGRSEQPVLAKRQGDVRLSLIGHDLIQFVPSPSMICSGDSGSPLLVRQGDVELIAGVNYRVDTACAEQGTAVRVDGLVRAFIEDALEPHRDAGCTSAAGRGGSSAAVTPLLIAFLWRFLRQAGGRRRRRLELWNPTH